MAFENLIVIKYHFIKNGYKMVNSLPDDKHGYIESSYYDYKYFTIFINKTNEYIFKWETRLGETLLKEALSYIQTIFPTAFIELGKNNKNWTKLFIPVNQDDPANSCFEIFTKTKGIIGYEKKLKQDGYGK
jgi:hypothetical protein